MISLILVSYNQENYILEMLESLYHQEERYGNGDKIQLIIADDYSNDNTFYLESSWAKSHKHYFKEILLLPSDRHRGINHNFLRALPYVSEPYYRGISGDDLLADIDLVTFLSDADLFIFSYFHFHDGILEPKKQDLNHLYSCYMYWGEDAERLKDISHIEFPFSLMGLVFKFPSNVKELIEEISQYEYLEDRPIWDYQINKVTQSVVYINAPIVLRRISVTSIANAHSINKFHDAFNSDVVKYWRGKRKRSNNYLEKIGALMFEYQHRYPHLKLIKMMNPYKYFRAYRKMSCFDDIKRLISELDDNYFDRNDIYLRKIKKHK